MKLLLKKGHIGPDRTQWCQLKEKNQDKARPVSYKFNLSLLKKSE